MDSHCVTADAFAALVVDRLTAVHFVHTSPGGGVPFDRNENAGLVPVSGWSGFCNIRIKRKRMEIFMNPHLQIARDSGPVNRASGAA